MDSLIRKIQIAYMDSLSLNSRTEYIRSDIKIEEILRINSCESDHYNDALDTFDWLEKGKGKIIWYGNEDYPDYRPIERKLPYFLLYKGIFPKKNSRTVSIVGTRHVDNEGFQMSFKLGLEASVNGISVVSGLAEGCDQAALNGAVCGGFCSFGVLGCGLECDYPKYSDCLKNKMINTGGAVISRFPPDYPPLKYNFPNRNLTIASMGNSTVVVQAPRKSGSLITADMCLQMGRDLFVSAAGIGDFWGRLGSSSLADDGAPVIDTLSDYYDCTFTVGESFDGGFRFGNKHYCIRKLK